MSSGTQSPFIFLLKHLLRNILYSMHCLHELRRCSSFRSHMQTWCPKEEEMIAPKCLFLSVRKTIPLENPPVIQDGRKKKRTPVFSSIPLLFCRIRGLMLTDLPVCQKASESWIFLWSTLIFKPWFQSISFYTIPRCSHTVWTLMELQSQGVLQKARFGGKTELQPMPQL